MRDDFVYTHMPTRRKKEESSSALCCVVAVADLTKGSRKRVKWSHM